jgi:acyl-CoA synthetase (AMP-forming)/AMP-acid ligase II
VPADDGVELVSVGRPLAGMDVSSPIGAVGPIRVRGPSVMTGYLHQPERTTATVVDGWLDTGDLGFLHDGELYVCGRAKDVVILRGRNHSPHEIEHAVGSVPGVWAGGAAAVGHRPEDGEDERLLVFAEARHPERDLARRCREAVLGATGLDAGLVVVLAPGTLPRTSSGKIRRGETLARWLAGTLVAVEAIEPWMLEGALADGTLARRRGADGARGAAR